VTICAGQSLTLAILPNLRALSWRISIHALEHSLRISPALRKSAMEYFLPSWQEIRSCRIFTCAEWIDCSVVCAQIVLLWRAFEACRAVSTADSATGLGACPRAGGASEVISLIEIAVVCAGFTRVGSGPGEEAEVHAGPEAAVL